ncbi:MAG TPA: tRNA (adenosine(37)-N6)-threonylcarbamoyltransferase complex transferase subunit TsaD [Candidatus Saccharimonadales bacterium]|nr:tRNA (adenosine(37)-N6)-threonylcarbamoyltransferase complex transferase subunit TsaD [Candidatus Saccharimonadales bacterium]
MIVLGIETSCDETAVGIVRDGYELLANTVHSQIDIHKAFGGVVPEVAARSHIEVILPVLEQAMSTAKVSWEDIDAIAVTYGPGLIGSLMIGTLTARTLAIAKQKPLYGVNHVEGHVYANFITKYPAPINFPAPKVQPKFPLLALIVSGGHSQLALFKDHFDYSLLGQTQDDAIGEAFDKVAKIIGLPYPGGPSIAKAAANGDPLAYEYPKAKVPGTYDFSFSGPKTAVLRHVQRLVKKPIDFPSYQLAPLLSERQRNDVAASFQRIAIETVVDKTVAAFKAFEPSSVVIAGGVAASGELRRQLAEKLPAAITYIAPSLCTDNGAMIAALGCFKVGRMIKPTDPLSLRVEPSLSM